MANVGKRVFNAQMLARGPKTMTAMMTRAKRTILSIVLSIVLVVPDFDLK